MAEKKKKEEKYRIEALIKLVTLEEENYTQVMLEYIKLSLKLNIN